MNKIKAVICLVTMFSLPILAQSDRQDEPIGQLNLHGKLMVLKRLGDRALNVRDIAPKNGDEAFQLRSEIDHPVISKNKRLGYCQRGEWPLSRRVDVEIPFKMGRKKACTKALPKLISKGKEKLETIINPLYGSALEMNKLIANLEKNYSVEINNCIGLSIMLNRLSLFTKNNIYTSDPRNSGKRINATQGLEILNRISMDDIPSEKNAMINFSYEYATYLTAIDLYAQNFRYDRFFETVEETQKQIEKALDSGCL